VRLRLGRREKYVTKPSISAAVVCALAGARRRLGPSAWARDEADAAARRSADAPTCFGLIEQGGRQHARKPTVRAQPTDVAVATAPSSSCRPCFAPFTAAPEVNLALGVGKPRNRLRARARARSGRGDRRAAARTRQRGLRSSRTSSVRSSAPDDPLAGGPPLGPDQLATGCGDARTRIRHEPALHEFLADNDIRPQSLTLGSNGAIKEAVRLGLGVSIQVARRFEHELGTGALAEVASARTPAQAGVCAALGNRCHRAPAVEKVPRISRKAPAGKKAFEGRDRRVIPDEMEPDCTSICRPIRATRQEDRADDATPADR